MKIVSYALHFKHFPSIKVLHPIPDPTLWGSFSCLQDTVWEAYLPIVQKSSLDYALHGQPKYLLAEIGRDPEGQLRKIPSPFRSCQYQASCNLFNKSTCFPHRKMPDCFSVGGQFSMPQREALDVIFSAWKEGTYVIIVEETSK